MSADLFAAFGEPHQGRSRPQENASSDVFSSEPAITNDSADASHNLSSWKCGSNGNNVLFDAETEVVDDDFGDFEAVDQRPTSPIAAHSGLLVAQSKMQQGTLIDLLSVADPSPDAPHPAILQTSTPPTIPAPNITSRIKEQPTSSSTLEDDLWGDFEAFDPPTEPTRPVPARSEATLQKPRIPFSNLQQPADPEPDEDWEAFEDGQPSPPPPPPPLSTSTTAQALASTNPITPATPRARPTTIPPPSLLLSLLPTTFQHLLTSILGPSNSTTALASQIQCAHRTTARIIAGRSLRWRRDTLLAQSTRIAAAGKPGGMKLTSVNKGENTKEEREAAEAVEVWNRNLVHWQVGSSKAKLSTSRVSIPGDGSGGLKLSMLMNVKAASGPAVMEAKMICALCGMKRSERVVGVDDRIEDVFGEFWVESWGHKECEEWWEGWKRELSQR